MNRKTVYEMLYGVNRTVDTEGADGTGNDKCDHESAAKGKPGRMAGTDSGMPVQRWCEENGVSR